MGSYSLLQGIFLTQELNHGLLHFRQILYQLSYQLLGFPGSDLAAAAAAAGGSVSRESTHNVGDLGSIPGLGRSPGGGHDNPLQSSCLENPHGQRSLVDCSRWDDNEVDTTEQLMFP